MRFYDWRKVQTMVNGKPVTNWAPGDDCYEAERIEESVFSEVGADGMMTASLNPNKSGTVKIKLAQTSPLNAYLQKICLSQDNLDTFVPVVVSQLDTYRQDATVTTPGFLKKPAKKTRGVKANVAEWEFVFPDMYENLGDPAFVGMPTAIAEALG